MESSLKEYRKCIQHRYNLYEGYSYVVFYVIVCLILLGIGRIKHNIYKENYKKRYDYKDPIDPGTIYPYWIFGGLFGLHRAKLLSGFGWVEYILTSGAILLNLQNIFLYIDSPSVWGTLWHMNFINIIVTLSALLIGLADVFLVSYNVYVLTEASGHGI